MHHATDLYFEGFLAGQAVAYCQRVNTGSGLAAEITCPNEYINNLVDVIAKEGCLFFFNPVNSERTTVWIYRVPSVKRLIEELKVEDVPTGRDIWTTGKLFGYADREVLDFIERSSIANR